MSLFALLSPFDQSLVQVILVHPPGAFQLQKFAYALDLAYMCVIERHRLSGSRKIQFVRRKTLEDVSFFASHKAF